ncbi:hypothetical protein RZS08_09530, partial [Arthrospira platensis SPKY1]|nr:hypothetical protein [Arthrospira platensis SPKY1]
PMKTLPLLLLSLFACLSLSAQTWPLVQNDRICNYRHSAESLISNHIWVDSVGILPGGDSVLYLNRIARLFFDVEPPDDVVDFGLTNQQQFLQRQVRKGADGGYRFEGDSATFVLFGGFVP